MNDIRLAKSLGWFSIALGAFELLGGLRVAGSLGVRRPALVRGFGAREIAAGLTVLAYPDNPVPMWGRVAGDALDLLALATAPGRRRQPNTTWATVAVLGATALDVACATALTKRQSRALATAQRTRIAYAGPSRG